MRKEKVKTINMVSHELTSISLRKGMLNSKEIASFVRNIGTKRWIVVNIRRLRKRKTPF